MVDVPTHLSGIFILAFSLGLLHAFDADHILAVTTLSAKKPSLRRSIAFCKRWALGHGLALLLISSVVLFIGFTIPQAVSHVAEQLVGLVLLAIGLWVLMGFWQREKGQGLNGNKAEPDHRHSATLVGLLHGTAGSAPLLALLPMSQLDSPWLAFAYVLLFGLGVIVAMLLFGGLLQQFFILLSRRAQSLMRLSRGAIATLSIAYGLYLIQAGV